MIKGVNVRNLKKNPDGRGFFAEIFRDDWKDFIKRDRIAQASVSMSKPGVIRAWHRHSRGQIDYVCVLKGKVRVCVYDDAKGSKRRGQLDEIVLDGNRLQIVRIPGLYWHGTKCIGKDPSVTIYMMTKLYDYANPDEERRAWNDPSIIDPKRGKPYDWNG